MRAVLDNTTAELGLEAYLNLDHAPTVDDCLAAIDAGFEFVHLDLFQSRPDATEKEVVAETRRVVAAAGRTGAVVEGEQLALPGRSTVHSGDAAVGRRSTPEGARRFVEATGIDVYAAAVGNVHGRYARPAPVDLDLLASLHEAVDVALSLHGGSGVPGDIAHEVAQRGVAKININSDVRYVYRSRSPTPTGRSSGRVRDGQAHRAGDRRRAGRGRSQDPGVRQRRHGVSMRFAQGTTTTGIRDRTTS